MNGYAWQIYIESDLVQRAYNMIESEAQNKIDDVLRRIKQSMKNAPAIQFSPHEAEQMHADSKYFGSEQDVLAAAENWLFAKGDESSRDRLIKAITEMQEFRKVRNHLYGWDK